MSDLNGKVALVVGGSGGIGAASARNLAAQGARICLTYNRGAEKAAALIESFAGVGHVAVKLAIEDGAEIAAAVELVARDFGRLDILVNASGVTRPVTHGNLDGLDDALLDQILIANVRGPFSVIRAFVPLMRRTDNACIVNVSSISAFTGSGSNIGYCASKAALDVMTMSLARVLGPEIRVLCVSPGAVATDFVAGRDRSALETIAGKTPLRRVIEPEDVARAVSACVTHLTASTGARIVVDGGRWLV